MLGSGWLRGFVGGALVALAVLFLPSGWLSAPASAAGLDVGTTRAMLMLLGFVAGAIAGARLARSREEVRLDASVDRPLPMPQMAMSAAAVGSDLDDRLTRIENLLATLPAQTTKAIRACPSADLDRTLRSIQRALRKPHSDPVLVEAVQTLQTDGMPGLISRLETLETQLTERLSALDARLALLNIQEPSPALPLPSLPARRPHGLAPRRIGRAVADIRRAIDSLPH